MSCSPLQAYIRVEDGHVRAGKPGARGRVAYVVTRKGKKWLKAAWLPLLQEGPSGGLVSDPRVFLIAARVDKEHARAEAFLRSGLEHRQEALAELEGKMKEEGSGVWLADQYVGLRARATAAILSASNRRHTQGRGKGDRFDIGWFARRSPRGETGASTLAVSFHKPYPQCSKGLQQPSDAVIVSLSGGRVLRGSRWGH